MLGRDFVEAGPSGPPIHRVSDFCCSDLNDPEEVLLRRTDGCQLPDRDNLYRFTKTSNVVREFRAIPQCSVKSRASLPEATMCRIIHFLVGVLILLGGNSTVSAQTDSPADPAA